jgi:hypothetical protein
VLEFLGAFMEARLIIQSKTLVDRLTADAMVQFRMSASQEVGWRGW